MLESEEVNTQVAEKILGWKLLDYSYKEGKYWYKEGDKIPLIHAEYWHPTLNLGQAWLILEKFKYPEWSWSITNNWDGVKFILTDHRFDWYEETEMVIEEAICRTCLRAWGIHKE